MSVVYSLDGARLLASASGDGTVRVWDVTSGTERVRLSGHDGSVLSVVFSPDGTRLASGGEDGTVRVWDALSGAEQACLTGHDGWVRSVVFSPDGARLASAGADGTVRLWTTPYSWIAMFVALPGSAWATLLPDGRYKLHGNPAGRIWWAIKLCRFEPGELDPYVRDIRRIPDKEPILYMPVSLDNVS
jgi:WD40 repeat protein